MATGIDVACFGELLWDFFEADAKTDKEPIARTFRREIGGATANVATVLARLGIATSVIGAVGDDKLGSALKSALAAEGVDVSHVAKLEARTGITFVTRAAGGEPTFLPYREGTADMQMSEDHVTSAMAKARWAIVSSTSMLGKVRPATEKFVAALQKAKGSLVVDLNARAHLWPSVDALRGACAELVSRAAVVKASEKDLSAIAGKRGVSWLEENAKQATWILTRGENGAAAVGAHGQATAPTKRVRAADATGAGDAFVAGVVAVLVKAGVKPDSDAFKDAKLWTRAMEVGHQLGSKSVAAVGAVTGVVGLDDIRARIR
ncbi:2-dehydro-3-deoxygluconate kinase [Labilithrix luteola]|uniref:2-dehydro-3-deoxygluconate kinase n=1 Tax=Labilithrix luteola TaxID=1391654 RepID=A0A0K1Q740_9BACT|nr:PfkB family carbohydrate kinase [Labilithrix luteola]AKV01651.1 2-dehydro-3-deoxygluconate kinase [Labilithrix luteola]